MNSKTNYQQTNYQNKEGKKMLTKEQRNNVQFKKGQVVRACNTLKAVAQWFEDNGDMVGDDPYTRAADVAVFINAAAEKVEEAIRTIGWLTEIMEEK